MKYRRLILQLAVAVAVVLPMSGTLVYAADTKTDSSNKAQQATGGGNVQGYAADAVLQIGTVVQLKGGDTPTVSAATSKDLNQMYGAVVDPHQLSLTISNESFKNEAFVATSGTYDVLVSTEGGPINTGDFVTMSSIDGVAKKAGTEEKTVFGRAVETFSGKNGIGNVTLKDTTGAEVEKVVLGTIKVTINIQRNPNIKTTKANVPKQLEKIGQAIADKPVSAIRIYLSVAITVLCIIIAIIVLQAGIRNSIISIGRNPLSKKSIFRGLMEIILTSFLILIIGLFTVYLILKL